MQNFPTTNSYWDTTLLGSHPLGSFTTPPLTITKIEWEDRSWNKVLKLTFAENIKYSGGINNTMYFLRFAENDSWQNSPDAEAFFYFVNKLNQPIQIPLRGTCLDEQGFIYWVLSDEVIEEIREEKNKWDTLSYTEEKDLIPESKSLVEKGINKAQIWKDIYEGFAKEIYRNKTYQQFWEDKGLTYQDAQELIPARFKPSDYYLVQPWKNHNFISQQTNSWIKVGLTSYEHEFAAYLRGKGYQPNQDLNLEQLREEFYTWKENSPAQEYLDIIYPLKQRNTIKELNISQENLTGGLNLTNWTQLNVFNCSNNNLSSDLILPSSTERLTILDIRNNNLSGDCSLFSHLVNLETLWIGNDNQGKIKQGIANRFTGSLKPLQNLTKLKWLNISNTDIDNGLEYLPNSLEKFNCSVYERKDAKAKVIYNLFANDQGKVETEHGYIKNFPQKLQTYKQWTKPSFAEEEIKQWKEAGARVAGIDDYGFIIWLKEVKNLGPEWITNYKEDCQALSNRFKKYGLCLECKQLNTGEQWCKSCNNPRLQKEFVQWTSNNPQIDKFIQKYQLEATEANKFLEWIPHEQFTEIEHLDDGGFGKVYKAKWTTGNIHHWDIKNKKWNREKDEDKDVHSNLILFQTNKYKNYREVVLKNLNNSSENTDFLQETANHKIIDDWFNNIVPYYGISQDPTTKNYLMVMQYMPEGNLRKYLSKNNQELSLEDKL
ncbi:MAG: hypothetical protein MRECE_13c053, partial [Mycoplasmataceae bacterium CE_OT135]